MMQLHHKKYNYQIFNRKMNSINLSADMLAFLKIDFDW